MSDSLQHSILSYPSGAWDGATLTPVDGISSVENPEGLFDPDLSNYTTLHSNSGSLMRFTVSLTSGAMFLPGDATVGLIGMSDSSNATDQTERPMNGILDVTAGTGFDTSQNHSRAVLFPTTIVSPTNPDIESSLLSGGQVNLIFNEVPRSSTGAGNVEFDVRLIFVNNTAREVKIGHLFVGLGLPLTIDPDSFAWRMRVVNERTLSRGLSLISGDGVLAREAAFDIVRIPLEHVHGQTQGAGTPLTYRQNLMRAVITNTGRPMLLSPYPHPIVDAAPDDDDRLLSMRQNFFSIYGLFDQELELSPGQERDGQHTLYSSHMAFNEVR